jgi:hypothetical protein
MDILITNWLERKGYFQYSHASNFNGNADQRNYESQDVVFTATSKNEIITDDIWICDIEFCGHYCKSDKGLFDVKDINEKINVEMVRA